MSVYPKAETAKAAGQAASGVPAQPSFPELEEGVLAYWAANDTFRESVAQRPLDSEFVFYDGPPFANGLPHYGHLITGYVKDVVPRFRTMQGRRVERRFGWDCHGLPAEVEAERLLGISGKAEIMAMGIEKFNAACRESVLRYTHEWRDYVTRQARWVDFDNDYKTLDTSYMESVMWAFKQLWDKGLIYQGFKVLPYCWRCETPLSNHELRMDEDVYKDRQDPSVTVRFKLETGEWLLAWTTTPWTLPVERGRRGRRGHQLHGAGEGRRALHPGPRPAGRLRARARGGRDRRRADRRGAGRPPVRAAAALSHRHREVRHAGRLPGDPVRRRHDRGRHRRRAHGTCLRRGRRAGLQRGRHPDRADRRRARPVHLRRARLRGPARLRRQPGHHRQAARAGQPGARADLHPLLPALLALPEPADLQGGVELVRRGHQVLRTGWSS